MISKQIQNFLTLLLRNLWRVMAPLLREGHGRTGCKNRLERRALVHLRGIHKLWRTNGIETTLYVIMWDEKHEILIKNITGKSSSHASSNDILVLYSFSKFSNTCWKCVFKYSYCDRAGTSGFSSSRKYTSSPFDEKLSEITDS